MHLHLLVADEQLVVLLNELLVLCRELLGGGLRWDLGSYVSRHLRNELINFIFTLVRQLLIQILMSARFLGRVLLIGSLIVLSIQINPQFVMLSPILDQFQLVNFLS